MSDEFKIVELPKDKSVSEAIKHFSEGCYEAVMLIGINKDSTSFLETSKCNGMQKAYMVQFALSYMSDWMREYHHE